MKVRSYPSAALLIVSALVAIHFISADPIPASQGNAATKPSAVNIAPTTQAAAVVKIDNFNFDPKELNITAGTVVTWQNADDVPHTATSKDDPQLFDSGPLDTDEKYSFTFSKAGKYTYYCKVHPHMTAVIVVK